MNHNTTTSIHTSLVRMLCHGGGSYIHIYFIFIFWGQMHILHLNYLIYFSNIFCRTTMRPQPTKWCTQWYRKSIQQQLHRNSHLPHQTLSNQVYPFLVRSTTKQIHLLLQRTQTKGSETHSMKDAACWYVVVEIIYIYIFFRFVSCFCEKRKEKHRHTHIRAHQPDIVINK